MSQYFIILRLIDVNIGVYFALFLSILGLLTTFFILCIFGKNKNGERK